MLRSKKLSTDVWEISGGIQPSSNIYYIKSLNALIDCGSSSNKEELRDMLNVIGVNPNHIKIIILTHLHFDHIGNISLFPKATVYASADELTNYNLAPYKTTGSQKKLLEGIKLIAVPERVQTLRIIPTPGHTRGSICIWKSDDNILFTGDTLYRNGQVGCTETPTSKPGKIQESLQKLLKLSYKEIAPGHNLEDGLILQQHH